MAEARTRHYSEDMFYDIGVIYDRPSVPSDRYRKADVFPQVPLLLNKKKDMFDGANRINIFGREDMFRTRHVAQIPVYLLKMDN